ncbi:PAS domain S-box protein [Pseudomonas sp. IC_126]|uniref:sensor histidine kinase n=1 Tax=Pseudomonas sp. IC_126 TaxID=2547400 RepID=UPI00103DDA51|nr:histidine kinase dimerization/phosphoacceptor domain -containing protein [Pseudomonas sp. IC_126]TCD20053.1 PAS domain S-box protein [Pseudomonas sp. IC_126]
MNQTDSIASGQIDGMGEREFRELADNAPVMIWRSRTDKLCDWFNKPWQDFSGKTQEQLFGYGWTDDVHPEDFDRCVATYTNAFDARESFTMPYRLRRSDGVYRWFLDNGAPFFRNGEFAGYFGSCIDITEQRDLEEHQRVLLAELNHRVKNNLQLIISFLQLSKNRARGDEAKTLLQGAISRIHGVGAVQNELHKYSSGTVDLAEYLPNLARNVLSIESGESATLVTEAQTVKVPFQTASNLGLIVNELMINAIKHGGVDRVFLTVKQTGPGMAEICVADQGRGFSEEALADDVPRGGAKGMELIGALARSFKATVTRRNQNGAQVTISFPY